MLPRQSPRGVRSVKIAHRRPTTSTTAACVSGSDHLGDPQPPDPNRDLVSHVETAYVTPRYRLVIEGEVGPDTPPRSEGCRSGPAKARRRSSTPRISTGGSSGSPASDCGSTASPHSTPENGVRHANTPTTYASWRTWVHGAYLLLIFVGSCVGSPFAVRRQAEGRSNTRAVVAADGAGQRPMPTSRTRDPAVAAEPSKRSH